MKPAAINPDLTVKHLRAGGLITNYYCTSRCGHCLYGCSPNWEKLYMSPEAALSSLRQISKLGCAAVHVGGGEPFLKPAGLLAVMEAAREVGVRIDYVETNSSWYRDKASATELLKELRNRGLRMLLVSISPFHNEHIAFAKVKGVLAACRAARLQVLPWIGEFASEVGSFNDDTTHSLEAYAEKFGADYLARLPARYWIHWGGRALSTFQGVLLDHTVEGILASNGKGCKELTDTSHFHVDLFGQYIPGLCSGLAIKIEDLGSPLSPVEYPLLSLLFTEGINGLFRRATQDHDFVPMGRYLSKCHLCLEIRRHLAQTQGEKFPELAPGEFYVNV